MAFQSTLMHLFFFVLALVQPCVAWWDNGHMLVGEVASQLLAPQDLATIRELLSKWEEDFPNTNEISTAAIWSDLIKCNKVTPYCQSPLTPSLSVMEDWHYINLPLHVNATKWLGKDADLSLFKQSFGGNAIDVLEKTITTFKTTKSRWAANLVLRNFIHIFGDLHQPMHAVGGVSDKNPKGDAGGNFYRFRSPCAHTNLHALWDSGAGEYTVNWGLKSDAFKPQLEANASQIISWLPFIPDSLQIDQYMNTTYDEFTMVVQENALLKKIVLDTYATAEESAYKGLDLTHDGAGKVACPDEAYVNWAVYLSQLRIGLAGSRLSVFLTQFARQMRANGLVL